MKMAADTPSPISLAVLLCLSNNIFGNCVGFDSRDAHIHKMSQSSEDNSVTSQNTADLESIQLSVRLSYGPERIEPDLYVRDNANGNKDMTHKRPAHAQGLTDVSPKTKNKSKAMADYLSRGKRLRGHNGLENVTCDLCEFVVKEVRAAIEASRLIEDILALVSDICVLSGATTREVCTLIIQEYQHQILYIAENLVLAPEEVCGIVLGDSCSTPYYPGTWWTINLPSTPKPEPKPPVVPKTEAPKLRILQLTDIHLDPRYEEGAPAPCNEPLCCRAKNSTREASSAGASHRPLHQVYMRPPNLQDSDIAGKYGSYSACDVPMVTATQLFQHLHTIQHEFDVVYFTGDVPPHDVWNQSQADQLASLQTLDSLFRTYLPDKPLYQAVGNHESAPCNSFPPPGIPHHNSSWLFDALVDTWGRWLPHDALSTVSSCGSYSISPHPGFRIISLNNNYCYAMNFWLLLNETDPCDSLQWLVGELQRAEDSSEKVHLLMHIPPGLTDCMQAWSWNFYTIINRYENTVVNQFYGHHHHDFYQLFYDDTSFQRAVGVGFSAPSVTTYDSTNPAYRIYTVDGDYHGSSWAVLDQTTYYLNITEANEQGILAWKPAYSTKTAFNMTGLYAADFADLADRLDQDEDLFKQFYRYFTVLHDTEPCTGQCKHDVMCLLREGRSYDPDLCKQSR